MHMPGSLTLGSYGAISDGCPMDYSVNTNDDTVDFTFGTAASHYFEFGFDSGSLREFVKLGIKALREMDAQAASKDAPDEWPDASVDAGELIAAGERSA